MASGMLYPTLQSLYIILVAKVWNKADTGTGNPLWWKIKITVILIFFRFSIELIIFLVPKAGKMTLPVFLIFLRFSIEFIIFFVPKARRWRRRYTSRATHVNIFSCKTTLQINYCVNTKP
jgi:antibiotic biosynthesis monooxygenase (ABM) superfamily enzyme